MITFCRLRWWQRSALLSSLLVLHSSHSVPSLFLPHLFHLSMSPSSFSHSFCLPSQATHCVYSASLYPRFPPSSTENANSVHTTKVTVCKWALLIMFFFYIENHLIEFDLCHKRWLCKSIKGSLVVDTESASEKEISTQPQPDESPFQMLTLSGVGPSCVVSLNFVT